MKESLEIFETRMNSITALCQHATLGISIELEAKSGHEKFKKYLDFINEKASEAHRHSDDNNVFRAFHLSHLFLQVISEFEIFLIDTLKIVLKKYPKKLEKESFKLSEILDTPNIEELVQIASERYLSSIMYKRPAEYRKCLAEILSADEDFLVKNWPKYTEHKARRDLGIHNNWKVNETYKRKIEEVGLQWSGLEFLPISNEYFWETVETIQTLMGEVMNHVTEKFN